MYQSYFQMSLEIKEEGERNVALHIYQIKKEG